MDTQEFLKYYENTFTEKGRELILEFFVSFSRFEFALKAENFVLGTDRIYPDWDRFISTIIFNPNATAAIKTAVNYILHHPPQIQSYQNNLLVWAQRNLSPNTPVASKLRLHISDIRNNLFHGGKFNGTFEPDNSRNYLLLSSALIILNNWLTLNPNVHHHFSENIN